MEDYGDICKPGKPKVTLKIQENLEKTCRFRRTLMKPRDSGEPGVREKLKEIWIFKRTRRFLRSWKKPEDSKEPWENLEI